MEDQPGPSGAALQPQDPALLAEAEAKFAEGITCIKENNLERAVQLFSEVLKVRTRHYGELAPECASAYYRYGSALLYQAQDNSDVLGGPLGAQEGEGDDADEKENEESRPSSAAGATSTAPAPAGGDDKGKGKAPAEEEGGGSGGEDGDGGGAEEDLQLAWENLEAAKHIWGRQPEKFPLELADVHLQLGDVGCENEDFEGALADYDESLRHLQAAQVEEGSRRVAEVLYKRCMALQFLDRPSEALEAVQAAAACLDTRAAQLEGQLAAAAEPEGEEAQRAQRELEDVAAIQAELRDKVEELRDVMEQHLSTKNALQSALETMSKMEAAQQQPAQQGPPEEAGFDKPSGTALGAAAGAAAAAAGAAAAPAPVKDLGVVGRGTKRLNLAPVQVNATATAAAQAAPAAKKKRSLEDLMGGGDAKEGETTVGFGAPAAASAAAPAAAPAAAAAAPALPAFLQPDAIKATYGGKTEGGQ